MEKPLFWVYGDVHERLTDAQQFLDTEKPEKVIWLGDFYDNHGGTDPFSTAQTATWLNKLVPDRANDIFIQSNHDIAYRFKDNEKYRICGWTPARGRVVREYFKRENWDRFVIHHVEQWRGQKLYFSHAGFHPDILPNGMFDAEHIEKLSAYGLKTGDLTIYNPILDHDGGPMWLRWQHLPIVPGICQVVGHTTFAYPQIRMLAGGPEWNLNLDCSFNYYAVFYEKEAYAIDRRDGSKHKLSFEIKK